MYTRTHSLQLQEVSELLRTPPPRISVDWLGAKPDPVAPQRHSPPYPGSRKGEALEDLRAP